jgi:tetratricopeptide (TPR) repeat protein
VVTMDGGLARLQGRHAAYYLGLAERAAPHLVASDDEEWLSRIGAEYPNVRAALTFTRDRGDPAEHARFAIALALYWRSVSIHREALGWLRAALAIEPASPGRARAEALAVAGLLSVNLDQYDEGFALVQQSLQCSALAGELPRPLALIVLALAALVQNRPEDVRRFATEAVDVARRLGDPFDLGEALAHAGMQIALTSDDPRGIELADESLDIARSLHNEYLLAFALESAGIARYRIDPASAVELLQQSLIAGVRNRNLLSQGRFIKAVAHVTLRQHGAAARDLCVVLPIMQEGGEVYFQSMALALTASILMRSKPDVAVRILALLDRLRAEEKFIGAPRDLEMQARLRRRAEERLEPPQFAKDWSAGRSATLDDTLAIALDELATIAEAG